MDCTVCASPVQDTGLVCWPCTSRLRDRMEWIAGNAHELDPVLARMTHHGEGTGRPSAETPLPVHLGALETGQDIRQVLTSWTLMIHEERGGVLPVDEIPDLARHLSGQLDWLRHREYCGDVWSELTGLAEHLRRAVDSPPTLTYLGPCGAITEAGQCDADLRAVAGAASTTCPACGTRHDAQERRMSNVTVARDLLADMPVIEHVLSAWGYPVPPETLRTWVHRGHLPKRGGMYRVGDALDCAVRWDARRSTKAA